ncbi:MAG: selenocysteine-specific translation elongation factor [Acidibacillus sp.]|nr:selenocysteine-specific translation elongation factor [Acidibacillus sp.]
MRVDFVIVGTAGHIDHGKTALVKALTGMDTDRTREEKERGISIELGFAPLLLPNGQLVGMVDVPGHERFIRNMLAGAGGMDLILLVVDAREGMMPQTREHVDILQMLELHVGIVVITKVDLVDDEWLELMHEEIRSQLVGTFFEHSPMVDVSSLTLYGIDTLRTMIADAITHVETKSINGNLRMPIDRVFTVSGFGQVVTGTIWRGQIHVGDTLELMPANEQVRVRSIQVHGEQVQQAMAGQRAAVAFTSVRNELKRGMMLATLHTLSTSRLIDVRVQVLRNSPLSIKHRMRIRFYHGTSEVIGRILLLREQEIQAGEEGLAQLMLEQPVVVETRDHFIIRSFSPMYTLGGGSVVDAHPSRLHRRHSDAVFEQLSRREGGSINERVLDAMSETPGVLLANLASAVSATIEEIVAVRDELVLAGDVVHYSGDLYFPTLLIARWSREFMVAVDLYYEKNTYDLWMPKSVAYQLLKGMGVPAKMVEVLLAAWTDQGLLEQDAERVQKRGRHIVLTAEEQQLQSAIVEELMNHPFSPPTVQELEKMYKGKEKMVRQVLHALVQADVIIFVSQDLFLGRSVLQDAEGVVQRFFEEKGPFTVADVRDQLGASRKYTVAILEYFDRQKKTRRNGDVRVFLGRS